MQKSTGIVVGLTALALVGGYNYYAGIGKLTYQLYGINGDGSRLGIQILVRNTSKFFSYPVPGAFINVFDANSNYIGSLEADNIQWVHANGYSILQTWVIPTYQGLLQLLGALIGNPDALNNLFLNGVLQIGNRSVQLDTHLQTNLPLPQLNF